MSVFLCYSVIIIYWGVKFFDGYYFFFFFLGGDVLIFCEWYMINDKYLELFIYVMGVLY